MIETFVYGLPADVHERVIEVMNEVCLRRKRIAVAESCTGGLLAAVLTDVEGRSHGFDRGFTTYTDEAKRDLLGVPEALLKSEGAVSVAVARAMAAGALERSGADVAISVTGFAGPGGPDDEAGLVYFGVARRGGEPLIAERHYGPQSRAKVRVECLRTAAELIKLAVMDRSADGGRA